MIEIMAPAELYSIVTRAYFTGQRMTDVLNPGHPAGSVPIFFKRQDRKHQIDVTLDAVNSIGTPGPQLRTDVIDHPHAATTQPTREAQVKVGPVDEDYGGGFPLYRRAF